MMLLHRQSLPESRVQTIPLSKELWRIECLADDACSLRRWVGPGCPSNLLHLGQDAGQVLVVMGNHS